MGRGRAFIILLVVVLRVIVSSTLTTIYESLEGWDRDEIITIRCTYKDIRIINLHIWRLWCILYVVSLFGDIMKNKSLSYYLRIILDMVLVYDDMIDVNFDDFFDMCHIPVDLRSDYAVGCLLNQAYGDN